MLAYDFPLLSLTVLIFWVGLVISIYFAVIWAFIDNFRRRDYGGWAKAGWALVIIVLPLLGAMIYLGTRPSDALDAR